MPPVSRLGMQQPGRSAIDGRPGQRRQGGKATGGARASRRQAFAQKAEAMPMTSCKQYEVLRKKLGERNRSPYRG